MINITELLALRTYDELEKDREFFFGSPEDYIEDYIKEEGRGTNYES